VSLIVLNWNGEDYLYQCLDSLMHLKYPSKEILMVDNCSTDNSVEIARSFSSVKIIKTPKNLGYAGGNNYGFNYAKGKYVATINNDIIVDKNWLEEPIKYLEANDSIGLISCRQMDYYDNDVIDSLYHYPSKYLLFLSEGNGKVFTDCQAWNTPGLVLSSNGASAIFRKKVVDLLKGFDERYFAYHEDADFCINAFYSGWKCLYVPNAITFHMGSRSFRRNSKKYSYYFERNRYFFIIKNYPLMVIVKRFFWLIYLEIRIFLGLLLIKKQFLIYIKARCYLFGQLPSLLWKRLIYGLKIRSYCNIELFFTEKKLKLEDFNIKKV
jgi:GT2 family glycosyltransferase